MNRAERRRLARRLGYRRSEARSGRRSSVRVPPDPPPEAEHHRRIVRLPAGLMVVRDQEPPR